MRKLRMGMIGGGPDAFIGAVHRMAANLDGQIELVCGAFSSQAEKSKAAGKILYLNPKRVYGSYADMIKKEKQLPEYERMDFVSIVTPNHVHFAPAKLALENGFHVIIDKPLTLTLAEAKQLKQVVEKTGLVLAVTHAYTGYPMVKEARQRVASGKLGKIRKVYVEYPQGWLSQPEEKTNNKQAAWRVDPKRSGLGGATGDIGTHADNLAEYITGNHITEVCAMLSKVVKGRLLDDDAAAFLKFDNDSTGVLVATQVAAGQENNLAIRVYGEKGGLEWRQEEPNTLTILPLNNPREVLRTGMPYISDVAKKATRVPAGHPEGYLEAFANIYRAFAKAVNDYKPGKKISAAKYDFPGVEDGVRGMAFIEAMVKSSNSKQKWTRIRY
ncbi:MAG TPA: Gfo/Idh/MocA family oxidoreductase [Cyclobacteriaceae bacterium]|nr:Gfo/Idh/MocA family oxidoreductase [Cyclobacteriaceae bacterium]